VYTVLVPRRYRRRRHLSHEEQLAAWTPARIQRVVAWIPVRLRALRARVAALAIRVWRALPNVRRNPDLR